MVLYYVDACIWRDYFEDRKDRFRPLEEWAFRFFQLIVENNDEVIISDFLMKELGREYSSEKVEEMLSILPKKLRINVEAGYLVSKEAGRVEKMYNLHFTDAIHAVLAQEYDAVLVTRDSHFLALAENLIIKKPEDLI